MTWNYKQSTGGVSHDGEFITTGYAGIVPGLNDPTAQAQPFVGPLPQGTYTIGAVVQNGGHMGPYVIPLEPWSANQMFGRAGFFIHGDNPAMDHSASDGCIILDHTSRMTIVASRDGGLFVV